MALRAFLPVRRGESRRLFWLAGIGMAFAAATALGDDIAQSVFVTRVGADALPRMFLFKGLLDVLAAALYLPLTRNRSAPRVWRKAIALYVIAVIGGRIAVTDDGVLSAYGLYVAHECAWTILTIHWGVFILDAFDASQARRLFPVLFTAARLGGVLAGSLLGGLAERVGAVDMLFVAAGFAALAGALSGLARRVGAGASLLGMRALRDAASSGGAVVDDEIATPPREPEGERAARAMDLDESEPTSLWDGWRRAMRSPLVRAIAGSTAAMVLVRYGMQMVSIGQISAAYQHSEDQVASFLGAFTTGANLVSMLLGLLVVPRLFYVAGVGAANLVYAAATMLALGAMVLAPGLGTAAGARFVTTQFKDALKTPLSTLFYGAEPPHRRPLSRAFVFGAVIPAATIATSLTFESVRGQGLIVVAYIALAVSVCFTAACTVQNRAWRRRMRELLDFKLHHAAPADPTRLARARELLAEFRPDESPEPTARARARHIDAVARGLASDERRVRAVAEEVLAETIPRRRAHDIARALARDAKRHQSG